MLFNNPSLSNFLNMFYDFSWPPNFCLATSVFDTSDSELWNSIPCTHTCFMPPRFSSLKWLFLYTHWVTLLPNGHKIKVVQMLLFLLQNFFYSNLWKHKYMHNHVYVWYFFYLTHRHFKNMPQGPLGHEVIRGQSMLIYQWTYSSWYLESAHLLFVKLLKGMHLYFIFYYFFLQ